MTQRNHTLTALLLVLAGLYLMRLTSVEIQPWDEGLYAVRGESIVLFDDWWDQTPHALGGLYSSTPPPLTSWGVAVGTSLLGRTAYGVRLLTLGWSILALWLTYQIGRSMLSYRGTIAAVVLLGTSLHWVEYSRQAMTEVPLMALTLLGLWASLRDDRHRWWGVVAIGGALMTKMTVGVLPALFFVPALFRQKHRWSSVGIIAAGLALAAPWYATMLYRYGNDVWMSMMIPHLAIPVEGNAGTSSVLPHYLYYVMQLILAHPFMASAFVYVLVATVLRTALPNHQHRGARPAVAWFVGLMLVLSIAATKNPHYVVMLLPAAALTAMYGYERMLATTVRGRRVVVAYAALLGATLLSIDAVRHLMRQYAVEASVAAGVVVVMMVATMVATMVAPDGWRRRIMAYGDHMVLVTVLAVGVLRAVSFVALGSDHHVRGGRSTAATMLDQSQSRTSFVYLYHRYNAGDAMNPQLAWYLGGWMNGWVPGYTYTGVALPARSVDPAAVVQALAAQQPWIVYYHPDAIDDAQQALVSQILRSLYTVEHQHGQYTVFRRR